MPKDHRTPHLPGIEHPLYGHSEHEWTLDEVQEGVKEAFLAASRTPDVGIKLQADSSEERALLRQVLKELVCDDYAVIQINTQRGWWQIKLSNGSIIRITS